MQMYRGDFKVGGCSGQDCKGVLEAGAVQNVLAPLAPQENQTAIIARLQPQPLLPFMETVNLSKHFDSAQKKAIICEYDQAISAKDQMRMAKKADASFTTIPADHSPFYSCPESCALAILS